MSPKKIVNRRIRRSGKGWNLAADIDAVVSSNTNRSGSKSRVSTRQRSRIVQRSVRGEEVKEDG
jgi:hypothetical protein